MLFLPVAPEFALRSTDTFVTDMSGANRSGPALPFGHASKIAAIPHLHMVTAGSEGWFTFLRWVNFLMGTRTAGDLLTADRNAPKELPAMKKAAEIGRESGRERGSQDG